MKINFLQTAAPMELFTDLTPLLSVDSDFLLQIGIEAIAKKHNGTVHSVATLFLRKKNRARLLNNYLNS